MAIGLLLLNDHVLKSAWPSILTDKLSDFAGLFFFPFLLAALLAPLAAAVAPRHRRAEWVAHTGPAAFVLTVLWFAAIKTFPPANALTAGAIGAALGTGPVRIALDPTDLIALVALWPAWRLWRGVRVEARRPLHARPIPRRLRQVSGTVALVLAALATAATSPLPQPTEVTRLAANGITVYTGTAYGPEPPCNGYLSPDGGHTWHVADTGSGEAIPATACARLAVERDTPIIACVPDQAEVCYRAAPNGQVETTADGGRTWTIAWGLPQHRVGYMQRVAAGREPRLLIELGPLFDSGSDSFDPGPFDIAVLPAGTGHRVVVAMGREGVAVRDPDGTWSQVAVADAVPTTTRATSFRNALAVSEGEYWVALLLSLAVGWVLSQRWGLRGRAWAKSFVIAVVWFCLALNIFPAAVIPKLLYVYYLAPITALVAGAVVLYRLLDRAPTRRGDPEAPMPADDWLVRAAVGAFFLAAWLPFPLWAYGVIPSYRLAIGVAMLGAGLVLVWGWQRARVDEVKAA